MLLQRSSSCCRSMRGSRGSPVPRLGGPVRAQAGVPRALQHHRNSRRPGCGPFSGARPRCPVRAFEPGQDPSLEDFLEVKVESVRVSQGSSVVYLRICAGAPPSLSEQFLAVHIGENESYALLKEINRQRQMRPLTHDLMKNMMSAIGYRVTKIRITDIIANTYYARVHLGRGPAATGGSASDSSGRPAPAADEVDVDARPSDAINLAVRFGAPMYVSRRIAIAAAQPMPEQYGAIAGGGSSSSGTGGSSGSGAGSSSSSTASGESHAEIVRSVREALASYEDPTIMIQLQKELAVKEERYQDAAALQSNIWHEMTHNQLLRLVVAMETALSDGRYEEAARLRDEYRTLSLQQAEAAKAAAAAQAGGSSSEAAGGGSSAGSVGGSGGSA